MNFDRLFIPFRKINSKWIIDLNINAKLKNFQKITQGKENLGDVECKDEFSDTSPKTQSVGGKKTKTCTLLKLKTSAL